MPVAERSRPSGLSPPRAAAQRIQRRGELDRLDRRNLRHRAAEQDARDDLVLRQRRRRGEGDLRVVGAARDVDADRRPGRCRWSRRDRCADWAAARRRRRYGRWSSRKRRPASPSVPRIRSTSPDRAAAVAVVPCTRRSACHSDSRPMPETKTRLSASSRTSSRQMLGTPWSAAVCALGGRSGSPRRRTPASCGTSAAAWRTIS